MYEKARIKQIVKTHGKDFIFKISFIDEFQAVKTSEKIGTIRGLYHEINSRINENKDVIRSFTQKESYILTDYDSFILSSIKADDVILFNNKSFRVIGFVNIQEGNYGIDISLEPWEFDDV